MLVEPCVLHQRVDKFQEDHAETFDLTFEKLPEIVSKLLRNRLLLE